MCDCVSHLTKCLTHFQVTGGRNGYGAKLCNIFSTKFTVETASIEYKRSFKQTWANNMSKTSEPKIKDFFATDFTRVRFSVFRGFMFCER